MVLQNPLEILLAIVVMGVLATFSYKKNIVSKSGLVAAFFLGFGIWVLTSWAWFAVLLLFFLTTALFTKVKYNRKRSFGAAQEKGGARDWVHVLANGGLPLAFVIIYFTLINIITLPGYGVWDVGATPVMLAPIFFSAFLGAVATATSDTLATEIGLLNPTPPRLITRPWRNVPPGTSGGVSLIGWVATAGGALMIGSIAAILASPFWFQTFGINPLGDVVPYAPLSMIFITVAGGIAGCTTDSLFGATIQGMWRCNVCHKQTEKRSHCGEPAKYLRGTRFFDNHMVNIISCLVGAIVAVGFYFVFLSIGMI